MCRFIFAFIGHLCIEFRVVDGSAIRAIIIIISTRYLRPRAKGWTFQGRPRVPVLQLLWNTFVG